MQRTTPNDAVSTLGLLEDVAREWMNLANLCAKVVELTENGFTIDSLTLQELRDAVNKPKFSHRVAKTVTE